jgi:ferredoxin
MLASASGANTGKQDYTACSGCSLCLLVCPVWRRTRDLRLTPHGRAKALQHGATLDDIAPSIEACTLCGACEPVCPENIGLVDMLLDLRRALPPTTIAKNVLTSMQAQKPAALVTRTHSATTLLAGATLLQWPALLAQIARLLGDSRKVPVETDSGADISLALEIGVDVPPQRLERFLAPLRLRDTVIVGDGLLLRSLQTWLPHQRCISLGVALSSRAQVRRQLRAGDLYVIEPRAYHAAHGKLVVHYDNLRAETGCTLNLDLQRIAIPATTASLRQRLGLAQPDEDEQISWLLKGRRVARIVVENADEIFAFARVCDIPVIHLAEVTVDEATTQVTR